MHEKSIELLNKAVADELKNQYYISYTPKNIIRDGRWRNIEIRARRSGVIVATRPGYYAPGDSEVSRNRSGGP